MSTSRMVPDEAELAAEENPQLMRLLAAMNRRVPSEEDRKLLLTLGRTIRQLREERRMTPAELACTSGIKREELEAIEAGRPYPGRRRARHRTLKCS
ncbi:MAG TPA: helix-turn-helix domain-containing protein [Solirubrobacteraceae bacterium]|jgi:DNA-binding XRE family transcriptional regulator|nr:helix-turn-helix domain-containing protein [Solirubrobacteraceae bacterium]